MKIQLLVLLFFAYSSYFFNDLLIKYFAPKLDPVILIKKRSYFTVTFSSIWLILSGAINDFPDYNSFMQIIALSTICGLGLFFFIKANANASFPNVIVINLAGLITQQAVAFVFLKEELVKSFYLSLVLIITGVALLITVPKQKRGLIFALLSTLFWSLGYSLLSIPLKQTKVVWVTFLMECIILLLVVGAGYLKFYKEKEKSNFNTASYLFMLMALLTVLGSVLFNHAYQVYHVSEISLLYMAFFPVSALIGKLYFKERLGLIEWLGNILIVAGLLYFHIAKP